MLASLDPAQSIPYATGPCSTLRRPDDACDEQSRDQLVAPSAITTTLPPASAPAKWAETQTYAGAPGRPTPTRDHGQSLKTPSDREYAAPEHASMPIPCAGAASLAAVAATVPRTQPASPSTFRTARRTRGFPARRWCRQRVPYVLVVYDGMSQLSAASFWMATTSHVALRKAAGDNA